jgi:hypothetical protein
MAKKRVAGTAYVKADGRTFSLGGQLTVSPTPHEREGVAGLSGVAGYKETPRVPFIEVEFITTPELSITALDNLTDVTVTAELANGKVYVARGAWTAGTRDINATEGTVMVRFEAREIIEQN